MTRKVRKLLFGTSILAISFLFIMATTYYYTRTVAFAETGVASPPSQKIQKEEIAEPSASRTIPEKEVAAPSSQHVPGQQPGRSVLEINPQTILIGLFFEKGKINVSGTLPKDSDAVLVVRGREKEESMSIRGKRLGLWMTIGTASYEHVPTLYQCYSSRPIAEIASTDVASKNGVGFEPIKEEMVLEAETDKTGHEEGFWKDEFVEFKNEHGLYTMGDGALKVLAGQGGMEHVEGEIVIPSQAPEGEYQVVLMGFKDGALVSRVEETLAVSYTRPVALLNKLANEHGWLYGIIAVIVALGAGLGVGLIVPSKGSH